MSPIREVRQSSFELAKWAAILAMAADHYGKIVDPTLHFPTHLVGRIAFPLFAWIIANRLALRPDLCARYIRWLLPWAIVSQPVFWYAGREWYEPNILIELLAGVLIVYALQAWGKTTRTMVTVILLACLGWFFDYGPAGVLSIAVLSVAAQRGTSASLTALAIVAVLVNLPVTGAADIVAAVASLAAPIVALVSLHAPQSLLPRLPKWFFYAFYPLHLLAFAYHGGIDKGIG